MPSLDRLIAVSSSNRPAHRVNILGVGISPVNPALALDAIRGWVVERAPIYVCVAAVHSILECRRDEVLRRILNASGMTTPDGMPLVWLTRLAGYSHVRRVYGPDLMLAVCQDGLEHGHRHFLYGGGPGIAEQLAESLMQRFPALRIAGTGTPPFRHESVQESQAVDRAINESQADILWVGLGTGKQERWMAEHRASLDTPVMIGVGAAFDFLSGRKPQAPIWMQRSGLEWLFRLATEPRRLWRRYTEYPLFLALLLAQWLRLKHFDIEG
jgi:N-acetylglucosaminyldiphosphoundecaprenol N-acetyl-beta-D-mannosaminyltransferase